MNSKYFAVTCVFAAVASVLPEVARAQNSVQVYGRLNLTLEQQKLANGSKLNVLQNNSSRWGLKGTEDLGSGLKASFALESGLSPDTGTAAARFWGRQSEVNLSGGFGMLRLGNYFAESYFATADYVSNHNHDTGTSGDALYAYVMRDINKIAYRTPEVAGLTAEVAVSLAEGAADRGQDIAVNWSLGGLAIGAGSTKLGKQSQTAFRAYWSAGPFGVGGYVQRDKNAWGLSGTRSNYRLSAMYSLGGSEFHINGGSAGKIGGVAKTEATQFTLGYNYKLSKRTKLYGFYTKIDDKGAVYGDFSSLAAGVRHNF